MKKLTPPEPKASFGFSNYFSEGSFWPPEYKAPTTWVEHTPFLFWLMGVHQPGIYVELGTAFGYSYFAACQAVCRLSLPTKCFAVDTWRGSVQNADDDESVYARVRNYNSLNFNAFSSLIRSSFNEAAAKFKNGSIDLLHVDAPHEEEEIRTLIDLWSPKLSPRSLILFHHAFSHHTGCGVPQVFEDLAISYPSFRFTHGQGLGVIGYGLEQTPEVLSLLELPDRSPEAEDVRTAYFRLGESLVLHQELDARRQDGADQADKLRELQERFHQQEKALLEIRQSFAWRITRPLFALTWFSTGVLRCFRLGPIAFMREVRTWINALVWSANLSGEHLFDEAFYRKRYPDLTAFHFSPRLHYLLHGWREDRITHPLFDSCWYRKQVPRSGGLGLPPLIHYIRFGRANGLNPGPLFSGAIPDERILSELDSTIPLFVSENSNVYKKAIVVEAEKMFSEFLKRKERMSFKFPQAEASVSVIIVLYNQPGLSWLCLRSLLAENTSGIELILIDNNPSNPRTAALLRRVDGAKKIQNSENKGFLRAVNQGAKHAKGKYLLLLNNDAMLLPGALSTAVRRLDETPDAGAVGGPILSWTGRLQEAGSILWRDGNCQGYGRGDRLSNPAFQFVRDVDFCSGAFLMLRRNVFDDLDGLDTIYEPAYYEDIDYCVRLWEHGYRVIYDPGVVIQHFEFAGSGNEAKAESLMKKNCVIFRQRHRTFLEGQFENAAGAHHRARTRLQPGGKRILFIDDRLPLPWFGSGFPRAHKFVETLANSGHAVSHYPLHPASGYGTAQKELFPETLEILTDYYVAGLPQFLQERQGTYDIILVSRPHNMSHLISWIRNHSEWFRGATLFYDAEAVFALREIKQAEILGHPLSPEQERKRIRDELFLAAYAQHILTVTPTEALFFLENLHVPVHVISHTAGEIVRTFPPFADRHGFLFIGNILNATTPNGDSLRWFIQEVWPEIRKVMGSKACLNIVGDCEPVFADELAVPGVILHGIVADLETYYDRARVFIAPTRFSAGLPLKAVDAAANGLPLVVSTLIAKQLGWQDDAVYAEAAKPFAEACLRLHTDEADWQKSQHRLLNAVGRDYSQQAFTESIHASLTGI